MIHTPSPTLHREIRTYLGFMDEARKEIDVAEIATYEACEARADAIRARNPETPGPGKYECNDDGPLAEMLHVLAGDTSFLDEEFGEAEFDTWTARIGRFTIGEDSRGFFYYMDYLTVESAQAAFARCRASYEADLAQYE